MTSVAKLKALCSPYWDEVALQKPVARLWRRDATLWKAGAGAGDRGPAAEDIGKRLGWLDLPFSMRGPAAELSAFAAQATDRGYRDVILLGMGGSSLSAEVLRLAFPARKDRQKVHVLDSTVPATVARVSAAAPLSHALFLSPASPEGRSR